MQCFDVIGLFWLMLEGDILGLFILQASGVDTCLQLQFMAYYYVGLLILNLILFEIDFAG